MEMEVEWVRVDAERPVKRNGFRGISSWSDSISVDLVLVRYWSEVFGTHDQTHLLNVGMAIPSDLWLKGLIVDAPCLEPESFVDLSVREITL